MPAIEYLQHPYWESPRQRLRRLYREEQEAIAKGPDVRLASNDTPQRVLPDLITNVQKGN